jgi:hypothetical protein
MNPIIINAFATVCAFANPTDCQTYLAQSEMPKGYTYEACVKEGFEVMSEWLEINRPGYLVARVRCTFVEGRSA